MRSRIFVHFIAVGVLCTPMLASTSFADQTDPVTVESPPTDQGPAFVPGTRLVDDLPADYIEECTSAKYFGQEGTFIKRRFMVLA